MPLPVGASGGRDQQHPARPSLFVQGFAELSVIRQSTPPAQAAVIGDVELTLHAASAPLDGIHQGVQITIGAGNLVAVETAGVESK